MIDVLRYVLPGLMVLGALGSCILEIKTRSFTPSVLQWFGATLLYTALLMRN